MGILDGIVEWIAEQIMYGLDMINTSVLGALGCDMNTFLRYFPAAETMYSLLVALAIGLILLGWVWNLFKNYGLGLGVDAEDPVKLTAKAILFIVLAYYADEIVNIALTIGGTPYAWILSSELPSLDFASFNSVLLTIIGVCANGGVALIVLILTLILAWNYITRTASVSSLHRESQHSVGLGGRIFTNSMLEGGRFANDVIGMVAAGDLHSTGSITGEFASQAMSSYMGITAQGDAAPQISYSDVEIGGGRITGTEYSPEHPEGIAFGMYHTGQYAAPDGEHQKIFSADGVQWYKQYAVDTVIKKPFTAPDGEIDYHKEIVKKMPDPPKRKDRM